MKNWTVPEFDIKIVERLKKDLGLPDFVAKLLTIRGITERKEIERFFHQSELMDPLSMKDMDKAVKRIKDAVTSMEKICIYGDYDCDGVTSTAILYLYLQSVYADVMYYIPDRNSEGYGMNLKAIDKIKEQNINLIITVDNGITAVKEIDYANSLGMDVVVTDHHKPLDILPRATAVVDPHRSDETAVYRDYCGAGLALMLCIALENDAEMIIENYSDLAAIGTVADVVPLTGDNRLIVKSGLKNIEYSDKIGLTELIEKSGVKTIDSTAIGFRLGPRINAAGRLASAYDALKLFITEDEFTACSKAELLGELNSRRQQIEQSIMNQISEIFEKNPSLAYQRIIILSSNKWNSGVIGIVCSKITEKYGKPSILISEEGEICKASGRSVEGFSLVDAVFSCSDLLEKYGGHPMAVGFSIRQENIPEFIQKINAYALQLEHMPLLSIKIDSFLDPSVINTEMIEQLKYFEPFGCENEKPVFALSGMRLERVTPVGNGAHLRISVSKNSSRMDMMKFFTTYSDFPYHEGDILDFAVSLEENEYNGKKSVSLYIKDIRFSGVNVKEIMYGIQDYELYQNGKIPKILKTECPERADFADVYRYVASSEKSRHTVQTLCMKVSKKPMNSFKLLMILDILAELGHIDLKKNADILDISLPEQKIKVSLDTSYIYHQLKGDAKNA